MPRNLILVLFIMLSLTVPIAAQSFGDHPGEMKPLSWEKCGKVWATELGKNLELYLTWRQAYLYDKQKKKWFFGRSGDRFVAENCYISDTMALIYDYTRPYVYDIEKGEWDVCPESFSYQDSLITLGRSGACHNDYAVAVGVDKVAVYDFKLKKWFPLEGITWPSESIYYWTDFETGVAVRIHRGDKDFHAYYKAGSGKWELIDLSETPEPIFID